MCKRIPRNPYKVCAITRSKEKLGLQANATLLEFSRPRLLIGEIDREFHNKEKGLFRKKKIEIIITRMDFLYNSAYTYKWLPKLTARVNVYTPHADGRVERQRVLF